MNLIIHALKTTPLPLKISQILYFPKIGKLILINPFFRLIFREVIYKKY